MQHQYFLGHRNDVTRRCPIHLGHLYYLLLIHRHQELQAPFVMTGN